MKLVRVSDAMADRWNGFVSRWPSFALMQSFEWGTFKKAQNWKVIRLAIEQHGQLVAGAQMLIKALPLKLASIAYIPRGPLVDWKDREITTALLDALHFEAHRQKAICVRIEPPLLYDPNKHDLLRSYGFQSVEYTNQPRCSMIVNLPEDMDELFVALPSRLREKIRMSKRRGVTVEVASVDDLPIFYHLLKVTGERGGFPIRLAEYYEQEWQIFNQLGQAQLFVARYEDIAIAAHMAFYFGKHAASLHSGFLNEYRNLQAGYLVRWTAMCWARERGCCTFDLWGIPDEVGELTSRGEPIPAGKKGDLWGVYYHKRAFRGEVVYYVGAYDFVCSSFPYRILGFAASLLGSSDKLAQISDRLS
jgi:lipid II:glycine glycyltransferase (peptidoglycan interpeptide bridge formation enzyme)